MIYVSCMYHVCIFYVSSMYLLCIMSNIYLIPSYPIHYPMLLHPNIYPIHRVYALAGVQGPNGIGCMCVYALSTHDHITGFRGQNFGHLLFNIQKIPQGRLERRLAMCAWGIGGFRTIIMISLLNCSVSSFSSSKARSVSTVFATFNCKEWASHRTTVWRYQYLVF